MVDIGFQWHSRVVRGYDQKSCVGTNRKLCVGTERRLHVATDENRARARDWIRDVLITTFCVSKDGNCGMIDFVLQIVIKHRTIQSHLVFWLVLITKSSCVLCFDCVKHKVSVDFVFQLCQSRGQLVFRAVICVKCRASSCYVLRLCESPSHLVSITTVWLRECGRIPRGIRQFNDSGQIPWGITQSYNSGGIVEWEAIPWGIE